MTMTGKTVYEETDADWDERFDGGWQEVGGSLQSMQFAAAAIFRGALAGIEYLKIERPEDLNKSILIRDYGCALGDGTAVIQAFVPNARVVGVDWSAKAVQEARARWPTVEFEVGDVLEPKEADIIWCSHVLEHLEKPAEAVEAFLEKARTVVVIVPEITDTNDGSHWGAIKTKEWLALLPEPKSYTKYHTLRGDPAKENFYLESNVLMVWSR